MEKQSFQHRFMVPVLSVFILALISHSGYFAARQLQPSMLQQILTAGFGLIYFISVALGSFWVYLLAGLRGASPAEGILAAAVTPFIWMTKEVLRLTESHPLAQCLYYYLNPLDFWLISLMALEMGIASLVLKRMLKKRGQRVTGTWQGPAAVILVSLTLVISAYAWGKGENLYVIFLEGFRMIFGSGL